MESLDQVPTRMRDRLAAIIADQNSPHRKFAASVLGYYKENSDPMLAEIFCEQLWRGQSSLVEENGKLIYRHQVVDTTAPEYQPPAVISVAAAPAIISKPPDPESFEFEEDI